MAFGPAQKIKNVASPLVKTLKGKLDLIKQQIKQKMFPGGKTKPGQVDDNAIKRLKERQKELEKQLKEAGG